MMIGFVQPGTSRGMFEMMIGSRKTTPPRMLRMVPFGLRHIFFRPNSSTRASSGVMGGAFDADTVLEDGVRGVDGHLVRRCGPLLDAQVVVLQVEVQVRVDQLSLMNCQMMRVISSPSSSTTVPWTLILAMSGGAPLADLRVSI